MLIRREVIRACGGFDSRYQWAYYMDCDYCFEARLRGFRLLQVPARLLHEESRSTRSLTLPLRCYACGTDDFDPVGLTCRCGVDLDIMTADSMTAVLRRGQT